MNKFISFIRACCGENSGSVGMLFALSSLVVTGVVGLAVDYGRALSAKERLQMAVDSASMAGAALPATANDNRYNAAMKIFIGNIKGTQLEGVVPTINATNSGVSVSATGSIKTTFGNVVGVEQLTFSAASSARSQIQNGGVVCLLALNKTTEDGLHLQGINKVQSEDCWAWVNSDHETAINATGASSGTGQGFCSHGGVLGGEHFSPTPYAGCDQMDDPFETEINAYNVPGGYACQHTDLKLSSGAYNLSPGVYCGDTILKPQADVTLAPGTYVFRDGMLQVQAGAPAEGDLAGFVIVDRLIPWYDSSIRETAIQGGGTLKIEGIMYVPQWRVNISGNGELNQETKFFAMIADHFYMEGNGKLYSNSDAVGAGMPDIMPKIKNGPLLLH